MSEEINFVWEIARNHRDHEWIGETVTEVLRETSGPWTVTVAPSREGWLIVLRDEPAQRTLIVRADPQRAHELGETILGEMRA
jgi:hypothetical protein